jgi:hypothetical protein
VAPFAIDTDAGLRSSISLLKTMESHIKLADARPGMLVDQAKELHRRTQGRIASLTNLLDRVSYLAITSGAETITADLIAATTIDNAAQVSSRTA